MTLSVCLDCICKHDTTNIECYDIDHSQMFDVVDIVNVIYIMNALERDAEFS